MDGVSVSMVGKTVQYLDEDGRLVTEKFVDYTRRNILSLYGTEEEFCEVWNGPQTKKAILEGLEEHGVLFEQMKEELGDPDLDEFDMIRHIAFGGPMLTRRLRVSKVRGARFLEKYQGVSRAVLERLLDAYVDHGVGEIDDLAALNTYCQDIGGMKKIVTSFGGREAVIEAVNDMEKLLYDAAVENV